MANDGDPGLDEIWLAGLVGGRDLAEEMPADEYGKAAESELQGGEFALQPEEGEQGFDHEDQHLDPVLSEAEVIWVRLIRHFGGASWIRVVVLEGFIFYVLCIKIQDDLQLVNFRW